MGLWWDSLAADMSVSADGEIGDPRRFKTRKGQQAMSFVEVSSDLRVNLTTKFFLKPQTHAARNVFPAPGSERITTRWQFFRRLQTETAPPAWVSLVTITNYYLVAVKSELAPTDTTVFLTVKKLTDKDWSERGLKKRGWVMNIRFLDFYQLPKMIPTTESRRPMIIFQIIGGLISILTNEVFLFGVALIACHLNEDYSPFQQVFIGFISIRVSHLSLSSYYKPTSKWYLKISFQFNNPMWQHLERRIVQVWEEYQTLRMEMDAMLFGSNL